ncbi:MAG: hypothetical protein KAJ62_00610 [Desulfobacteraceae bacterium]|nr:hypothetical protein [Desulfobacteraceae bacterium]
MGFKTRNELSWEERLRRSYYEVLRDELDHFMLQYSLVDSYNNFARQKMPYPFVETRELKPRARIPSTEFEAQNSFLVVFFEESIKDIHKKYIRFFDVNKTTKANLLDHQSFPNIDKFDKDMKCFETENFFSFLESMLPVDYALLIQRNTLKKVKYALTHFHVRIDWPIAEAAEDLAKSLRYISKDLYENGDKYAEDIQKKFFEYYGIPIMAGGRRTAAIIAAQYFRRFGGVSTVYVGSSESRSLLTIGERGVSKSVLVKLSKDQVDEIVKSGALPSDMTSGKFVRNYIVAREGSSYIAIFSAIYAHTPHALAPEGGKLRELNPDINWLTVVSESIMPKPFVQRHAPVSYKMIYS